MRGLAVLALVAAIGAPVISRAADNPYKLELPDVLYHPVAPGPGPATVFLDAMEKEGAKREERRRWEAQQRLREQAADEDRRRWELVRQDRLREEEGRQERLAAERATTRPPDVVAVVARPAVQQSVPTEAGDWVPVDTLLDRGAVEVDRASVKVIGVARVFRERIGNGPSMVLVAECSSRLFWVAGERNDPTTPRPGSIGASAFDYVCGKPPKVDSPAAQVPVRPHPVKTLRGPPRARKGL